MKPKPKQPKQKKFKILAAGDFHGDSSRTKKLAEKAEKENVDLVILTGDITGMIETENLLKPFIKKGGSKLVAIPLDRDLIDKKKSINSCGSLDELKALWISWEHNYRFEPGLVAEKDAKKDSLLKLYLTNSC